MGPHLSDLPVPSKVPLMAQFNSYLYRETFPDSPGRAGHAILGLPLFFLYTATEVKTTLHRYTLCAHLPGGRWATPGQDFHLSLQPKLSTQPAVSTQVSE